MIQYPPTSWHVSGQSININSWSHNLCVCILLLTSPKAVSRKVPAINKHQRHHETVQGINASHIEIMWVSDSFATIYRWKFTPVNLQKINCIIMYFPAEFLQFMRMHAQTNVFHDPFTFQQVIVLMPLAFVKDLNIRYVTPIINSG